MWMIVAAAASAALYMFGFALDPIPWLVWVAPLPILLLAPRVGRGAAFSAGGIAWLVGGAKLWWYYVDTIQLPIVLVVVMAVVTSAAFGGMACLFRSLILRRRFVLAAVAAPAAWVGVEYAMYLVNYGAAGEWWSIAYTQADLTWVTQIVSVTGIWGLTFVLMLAPAVIATVAAPGAGGSARTWIAVAGVLVVGGCVAFGALRIAQADDGDGTVKVAALALPASTDSIRVTKPEAKRLMRQYDDAIGDLADRGVTVVVLSEKIAYAKANEHSYLDKWRDIAKRHRIGVVAGMALGEGKTVHNVAAYFPADGGDPTIYRKNHLIPGLEDNWLAAGDTSVTVDVDGHRFGLAVCKDLDYSYPASAYSGLVLAPAMDFQVDGWWHSRIAIVRAVEHGFGLARAGQWGHMTVSDRYGSVLSDGSREAVASVRVDGEPTVYHRLGDWFAWLALAITAVGIALAVRKRREASSESVPEDVAAGASPR
ncbi:MAG TPA: nitrilase-related carbon-nitrogen hydrolase [Stackebrandtia sp.]|jgi:apolipoprotein N-acyltransferase|uniref:nitrilase-related carbon-nitrogen hydrolase n=1 Tax=Stackebrandtia sp. TaxID=2023065 RepID=UPI002D35A823|nr:nitrilase-related carbon-nitrogen hydrolase [Stackebrandtia sp.]HZE37296.1 nitrilase-related carbon-nitrogen hydrolase [Stackebrandtia sp.]